MATRAKKPRTRAKAKGKARVRDLRGKTAARGGAARPAIRRLADAKIFDWAITDGED